MYRSKEDYVTQTVWKEYAAVMKVHLKELSVTEDFWTPKPHKGRNSKIYKN